MWGSGRAGLKKQAGQESWVHAGTVDNKTCHCPELMPGRSLGGSPAAALFLCVYHSLYLYICLLVSVSPCPSLHPLSSAPSRASVKRLQLFPASPAGVRAAFCEGQGCRSCWEVVGLVATDPVPSSAPPSPSPAPVGGSPTPAPTTARTTGYGLCLLSCSCGTQAWGSG